MRHLFQYAVFSFILFCCAPLAAQDLLVTDSGDSLNCNLTMKKQGFIYFTYLENGKPRKTVISEKKVASMQKGYYASNPAIQKSEQKGAVLFGVDAGPSFRIAKISSSVPVDMKDHIAALKKGFTIGANLHYFVSDQVGLGIQYNFDQYQNETTNYRDKISLNYVGASLLNRGMVGKRSSLMFGCDMGYVNYKDVGWAQNGIAGTITGGTFGVGLHVDYGYKFGKNCHLNLGVAFRGGTLTKINVSDGTQTAVIKLDKEEYESTNRLQLTAGLRFGK